MNAPPALRELQLQNFYSRDTCPDLVQDFFVPVLQRAVRYDRTTYTFSPQALSVAAAGLAGLVNNDGVMRLICHHELPRDVVCAILAGHRAAEDAVQESLERRFVTRVEPDDLAGRHHLELLTWLVKEGRLDVKVAIPRRPGAIFHQKMGIVTDSREDCVGFTGSLNESRSGWLYGDEQLMLFNSWNESARLKPMIAEFERLWTNRADTSLVIPIPDALRRQLIKSAPAANPARVSRELPRAELWAAVEYAVTHDPQTTLETMAAQLWPHQLAFWRRHVRDARQPPRVLIADEVGLGKTIQAGVLLKTLVNRGQADRVLILAPAVARWQWQDELLHKFNIPVPVLDRAGGKLQLHNADNRRETTCRKPWRQARRLILSYDWLRRHQKPFLDDDFPDYDLIVFDEAHHARYREVTNPKRRRANSYLEMLRGLSSRTRGLLLLTATPMQLDPAELWALLQVLAPSQWSEDEFRSFYDVDRPPTLQEWDRVRQIYLRGNPLASREEEIAELARMSLFETKEHLTYIAMPASNIVVLKRDMTPDRIRRSMVLMRRSAMPKRLVSRHTRNLLRQYVAEGRLRQSVPQRKVKTVAVAMRAEERSLYRDITTFVKAWYQERSGVNRRALGFVMTHFRLRLSSSRYAFRESLSALKRRKPSAPRTLGPELFDSDAGDSFSDLDPETGLPPLELADQDQQMLADLLARCDVQPGKDSKFKAFLAQLTQLQADGYAKVMVFSQFRDTQVWLRTQLARQAQADRYLLAGLSGAEDWLLEPSSGSFAATERKVVMEMFRTQHAGVLLCTDTAAESLNFQFCSAMINYDIPWNPMRLEQRIGRIDRIGQVKPIIRIVHLFYRDTAEHDAYQAMQDRIDDFTEHVGALQPILEANLEGIIARSVWDEADPRDIRQAVRDLQPAVGFDLDDLAAAAPERQDPAPRLALDDLTYVLNHSQWFPDGYEVEGAGPNHWRITGPTGQQHIVTTDRQAHDYGAGTVGFFGPGHDAFPDLSAPVETEATPKRTIYEILHEMHA